MKTKCAWPVSLVLAIAGLTYAPSAHAAPCETVFAGGGKSIWTTEVNGTFLDAGLRETATEPERLDAFDFYTRAQVGAFPYPLPQNSDATGCKREGPQELVYPTRLLDNNPEIALLTTPKLYVDPDKPFARIITTFETPGDARAPSFGWSGDLGSDAATNVDSTSSGDATVTRADRWATSCEDLNLNGCTITGGAEAERDVEIAQVWQGRRAPNRVGSVGSVDGDGTSSVFYSFTVEPGEPAVLMTVVALGRSIGDANRIARQIDRRPREFGIFKGMSNAEINGLRNWDPQAARP